MNKEDSYDLWLQGVYRKLDKQRALWAKYDNGEITVSELFRELRKSNR